MTTACAAFMSTASVLMLPSLHVWRCRPGCGRIRMKLCYDGRMPIEHVCGCNRRATLPEDQDNLRYEARR